MERGVKALADKMVKEGSLFIKESGDKSYGTKSRDSYAVESTKPTEYADIWCSDMVSEKQYYTFYERACYGEGGDDEESDDLW